MCETDLNQVGLKFTLKAEHLGMMSAQPQIANHNLWLRNRLWTDHTGLETMESSHFVNIPLLILDYLWLTASLLCVFFVFLRFPWRTRDQKAETRLRPQCNRTRRDAILWPSVWNGLYAQTPHLQVHPHQPRVRGIFMGQATGSLQGQTGTWGCSRRRNGSGGKHGTGGEQGIAKGG